MTVAAVILAASSESALADADGMAAVRRIVDSAWAGGATPLIVVSFDPSGAVAAALAGAAVTLAEPAPPEQGQAAQIVRGADAARAEILDTDAVLLWPVGMPWVGPETVTSLIELHGAVPGSLLRPTWDGEPGWPVLLPLDVLGRMRDVGTEGMPSQILDDLIAGGLVERLVELGDPGVAIDGRTRRGDLPPYLGPDVPAAGHVHEWGAAQAEMADEGPLEGPALAPFGPAARDGSPGD